MKNTIFIFRDSHETNERAWIIAAEEGLTPDQAYSLLACTAVYFQRAANANFSAGEIAAAFIKLNYGDIKLKLINEGDNRGCCYLYSILVNARYESVIYTKPPSEKMLFGGAFPEFYKFAKNYKEVNP